MPVIIAEHLTDNNKDYVRMHPILSMSNSLAFLPVPKVGSTTMIRVLTYEKNWNRVPILSDRCKTFALIRHPVQRWISGTTERLNPIIGNDLLLLEDVDFYKLLSESIWNRHTQPQFWNFDSDTKLFKFEHMYKMWVWLGFKDPGIHERNHLTMGGIQKDIKEIVAKKAIHSKIESFYKEDLNLWNKAI